MMKKSVLFGIAILVSLGSWACAAEAGDAKMPSWAAETFKGRLSDKFDYCTLLSSSIPNWIAGDFDHDGRQDVAISVLEKKTHRQQVAILHNNAERQVFMVGPGTAIGDHGVDFQKMNEFLVERWIPEEQVYGKWDQLWVAVYDETAGILFWDGRGYKWRR